MGPFYELVTSELLLPVDKALLTELKQKNTKKIQKIDAEILDAEQNGRKSEVCQAFRKKSEYLCQIGDKDAAVSAFHQTFEKTDGRGGRIDLVFNLIRLGFFFLDHKLISANINKAKGLIQYRDWESKNRLRAYEGLYKMATGDFKGAAALFLEAVPIFGSYELMSYEDLVFYTVLSTVYSLDRPELREKVMRCNEIQEQLTGGGEKGDLIPIRQYVDAFYNCTYDQFFIMLAQLESQRLKFDRYLAPHYDLYSLDMRLKAYEQFLIPHTAVRLDMMAKDFGVSIKVLRQELGCLILDRKKLNYSIDDVKQIILKNNPVPTEK
uniref:PCI domain-containing protein n=1 Tax=Panagrolaimus superbus TaxID=310955 RepID=A0A914YAS6_9BILA